MLVNGEYVDGSWLLSIYIDDLNIQRDIRVHGEWSINELITQLIDGLICPQRKLLQSNEISLHSNHIKMNWEDYGLWWPIKSKWLLKTKLSLNQYGLQADAKLHFLSIYGQLNIQLPDLQIRKFIDINFAEPVYRVTLSICHYLNIRHSEELSLGYPIQQNDLKHSRFIPNSINKHDQTLSNTKKYSTFQRSATINTTHSQYKTLHKESLFQMNNEMNTNQSQQQDDERSMKSSILSKHSIQLYGPPIIRDKRYHYYSIRHNSRNSNHQTTLSSIPFNLRILDDPSLIYSPIIHIDEAIQNHLIVRPNNYIQRIRLNTIWLDSSKSLLEQGITMLGYNPSSTFSSSSMNRPNSSGQVQNDEYTKLSNSDKDNNTIPTLILRYKYGIYYDLNIKYDLIRINQLYEQAKWSILSEIYDVTDEEACLFAALQCQVELATEQETLMNDENLLNNDNDNEEHKGINDTIDTNDKQQLVNCSLDKSIIDNCNKNMKKMKSTLMKHNRDISPLGGYLHTTGYYSMKSSTTTTTTPSRPLSTIELDHEIDIMLDELSIDCLQNKDSNRLSNDIQHSKLKEHSIRPLSLLNTSNHNEDDIDSLMNHEQYDNDNQYNLPELNTYVKICKPRKFGLKVFHRYYISIKGIELYVYKNKDDYLSNSDTVEVIYLPGCEIQSDLYITNEKFNIRLFVPITRTNLPLSSAFASYQSNKIETNDEDPTISSKLKRRASLLSLTSLSHLSNALGISSSSSASSHHHTQNGLINISGIGALTGSSATMTGLINELWLRFFNLNDYIDWLTILRMTTAIQSTIILHSYTDIPNTSSKKSSKKQQTILSSLLNRSTFNIEHKAIRNLINLLSPNCLNLKQTNNEMINLTRLYNHLEKRFIDLLPLRLGYLKVSQRTWDYRRDHYYNQYDSLLKRSNTLTNQDKPPIHSQTIQTRTNFIQRITPIYSQINNLTSLQCKLKYINVWEQLHLHGIAFFTGRIEVIVPLNTLIHNENDALCNDSNGQINWLSNINQSIIHHNNYVTISISRKIESIGIGSKRIYRCDLTNGDIIASWKMSSIQSWHINWELNELILNLMNQTKIQSNIKNTTHNINNSSNSSNSKMDHQLHQSIGKFNEFTGRVIIRPIDVSVRMIAEFLGGYTFLNLRSPEKNQYLAEDMFYKLTTGISQPSI
ncbi:Fermitin 2 [Schistosoma haematobium]|uniref:Fermitin 2 n=2 Tax=Schistosoma haematobium TaxID=6185 RepID=A0A922IKP7_SCHHA|nr:Fermitin 2 [Schistosoma haematobium]KAH9580883.1 Fermitin 2 [Schistosoma haematobium]